MKNMKHRLFASIVALGMVSAAAYAQNTQEQKLFLFDHMDFGVTLGTTGIGFDLAMPATEWARIRAGFSYMPRVEVPMTFGVQVGNNPAESKTKFDRLSSLLSSITGNPIKPEVEMLGKPNFWNWKVMVDLYPLKNNRHWHATVGFFVGPSKVAEAYNKTESMASLMAVNIYNNNIYDKLHDMSPREWIKYQQEDPLLQMLFENISKALDVENDISLDYSILEEVQAGLNYYGRMGVHLGTYKHDIKDAEGNVIHKKDETYMMDPDENSMVKANMKVNAFKPYIGVGYDGRLLKNEDRLTVGFDAGIMMWGGTPHLTTHDGTDLIHDVENVPGKVGDYVSAMEKFKVFPLLNLRLAYRIF